MRALMRLLIKLGLTIVLTLVIFGMNPGEFFSTLVTTMTKDVSAATGILYIVMGCFVLFGAFYSILSLIHISMRDLWYLPSILRVGIVIGGIALYTMVISKLESTYRDSTTIMLFMLFIWIPLFLWVDIFRIIIEILQKKKEKEKAALQQRTDVIE